MSMQRLWMLASLMLVWTLVFAGVPVAAIAPVDASGDDSGTEMNRPIDSAPTDQREDDDDDPDEADEDEDEADGKKKKRKRRKSRRRGRKEGEESAEVSEAQAAAQALRQAELEAIYRGEETEEAENEGLEVWEDSRFMNQFLRNYGVDSELEPPATPEEVQAVVEIRPLLDAEKFAEAEEQFAPKVTPESSALLDFTYGMLLYQQEKLEDAERYFNAAVYKFPSFRRAYKMLGVLHTRAGNPIKAIEPLSEVVELGGGDGVTYGLLGFGYYQAGQYVSSDSAYRNAILLQPEEKQWKVGLTQAVIKQRSWGEAITLCDELLGDNPDNPLYWMLQANAYLGDGEPLKAAQNYELVDRLGGATVQSMTMLGDIYVNEELFELASRAFGRAVELDPNQPVQQPLRRVTFLTQRGAYREAEGLLETIKGVYSDVDEEQRVELLRNEARLDLARAGGGASPEAVAVLQQIIEINPLDGDGLMQLGRYYADRADHEQAIFYFERAASVPNYEREAKIRQAQSLVQLARFADAVPLLKRAQEIEPKDEVQRFLEQVERAARSRR